MAKLERNSKAKVLITQSLTFKLKLWSVLHEKNAGNV